MLGEVWGGAFLGLTKHSDPKDSQAISGTNLFGRTGTELATRKCKALARARRGQMTGQVQAGELSIGWLWQMPCLKSLTSYRSQILLIHQSRYSFLGPHEWHAQYKSHRAHTSSKYVFLIRYLPFSSIDAIYQQRSFST